MKIIFPFTIPLFLNFLDEINREELTIFSSLFYRYLICYNEVLKDFMDLIDILILEKNYVLHYLWKSVKNYFSFLILCYFTQTFRFHVLLLLFLIFILLRPLLFQFNSLFNALISLCSFIFEFTKLSLNFWFSPPFICSWIIFIYCVSLFLCFCYLFFPSLLICFWKYVLF